MARLLRISETVRNAMLAALLAAIDASTVGGTLEIYSGPMPDSPEDDPTGSNTLLATLTLDDPAGAIASGVLTFGPIGQDNSADATDTATWGRVRDGDGTAIFDGNVGTVSGQFLIVINTTAIVAGGPVQITSAVISIPATTG